MSSSLGRVTARLAEPIDALPPEMVDLINQNIKPPTPVSADDVYVRAMYIVSDQINSFGGRFPLDEHERLAQLLVDSPVLVGHRKDKLPVGRNFHAELVEREGHPWVKCYFYWLRNGDASDQLRDNVDGGIYKECSIAFTFNLPACSICGRDLRRCEHEPFETYTEDGVATVCHFDYRSIEKVLETSLVYRGAIPDTAITRTLDMMAELAQTSAVSDDTLNPRRLASLDQLDPDGSFLIVPRYDGLPLTAKWHDGALSLNRLDGRQLALDMNPTWRGPAFQATEPVFSRLVGYRGRERCTISQLEQYLSERSGPVSRLMLNLYPRPGLFSRPNMANSSRLQIRIVPHRIADLEGADRLAREIATRDGVEIWPLSCSRNDDGGHALRVYAYCPTTDKTRSTACFQLETDSALGVTTLSIRGGQPETSRSFQIIGFDKELWQQGRCFVAEPLPPGRRAERAQTRLVLKGEIGAIKKAGDGLVINAIGAGPGSLTLRPIRLDGRDLFLFSMSQAEATNG